MAAALARAVDLSRGAAPRWLGVTPIELPGGHSPMLTSPERLADLLIELAG